MPENGPNGQTLSGWTLVFDLDGTLVETAPDLLAALNHVLAIENQPPVVLRDVRPMIGHGAKAMIREGLSRRANRLDPGAMDHTVEWLWPHFMAYYTAHIADHSHPFPGVIAQLQLAKRAGATLAVCTNKTQILADCVLSALGMSDHFAAIVGADVVPSRKPDGDHIVRTIKAAGGDPRRAVMIGDSRTDERAALDAGLPFVFVTFGYEIAPVSDITADAVIAHYDALSSALASIVS
ncbi:MAG: HAD hydrolase-like protein [Pseudomonadota bacterium]